jgi:hypothetical protein
MTRYLIPAFIRSALNRGCTVEQFLGGFMDGEEPALRWIELRSEVDGELDGGVELWVYEVYDQGSEALLDLYDFTPLDGDAGEEPAARADTLDEALALAEARFGAATDRWVHPGVIQDEYGDWLRSRNPSASPP